jgi:iron complex outermembrane receptor protein
MTNVAGTLKATNHVDGVVDVYGGFNFNLADKYGLTETTKPNFDKVESDGVGLRLTWDINDSLVLTSITDVRSADSEYREDIDGSADDAAIDAAFAALEGLPAITGGITLFFDSANSADTFYQEFRLNGGGDTLEWFAGVSYYREELDLDKWDVHLIDTAFGLGSIALSSVRNSADNDSYGVYADATWHITDAFSVIGGVRWSRDEKDWCTNTPVDDLLSFNGPTDGELCTDEKWDEWTPRLVLQYDFGADTMVFASVAKGYKGGGFNVSAIDTNGDFMGDTIAPFDPETSIAYEFGFKSSLLQGLMQFNGSAFYNDYDDFQLQTAQIGGIIITNAGEAETKGVELELQYSPVDRLILMANYAYLDAEFTDGPLDGNMLAYAPENTLSVAADFTHDFLSGSLSWFAIYNYTDDYFHDGVNALQEDAYGVLNGKVTYTSASQNWDIALAADNITDEEYGIHRLDLGLGTGEQLLQGYRRLVRAEFNIRF